MKFDAHEVKRVCNGMLEAEMYERMYEAARTTPKPNIVEVGTAHAAGTVSLAMGLKAQERGGQVYSIDKISGGSRDAFGDFQQNYDVVMGNLKAFDVSEHVTFIPKDSTSAAREIPTDIEFGMMVLDADGCIDRDFELFFDRLAVGSPLVLDDIKPETRLKLVDRGVLRHGVKVDQKHYMGHLFLELFQSYGLLDQGQVYRGDTWMGFKGGGRFDEVPREEILAVYRRLIFTDSVLKLVPQRARAARLAKKIVPKAFHASLGRRF